jgi:hypothetical protein
MTTEQYSIGYEVGYQEGWNDAQKPQRTWVGLTDEEAADCWSSNAKTTWKNIEAKLKEKNT